MTEDEPKLCALHLSLGYIAECPGAWCPFWEQGGAVAPAGCRLERLGLDLSDPGLAQHLLDLRRALERVQSEEEAEIARREIDRLVPPDLSGA